MRLLRFLFFYVPLAGCGVILSLFLAQNWRPVQLDLFGLQYSIGLAWVLVGAMVFGALVAAVFMLPGRLAAALRSWSLERELQRWERDLWRLQERRERLLFQHERLLEAHERMLLAHQELVEEHSLVVTERDEARAQVDAARALPAPQPVREPIPLARVVGASSAAPVPLDSPDSPVSAPVFAPPDEPRLPYRRGGNGSVPSPAARPAAGVVREAPHDDAECEAGELEASARRSVVVEQPPASRAMPIRLAEPSAVSPAAAPVTPSLPLSSSPHHATVRSSASQPSLPTLLRSRLRADIAEGAATLAALRAALVERRAHLTRALYQGKAAGDPSGSGPGDLPDGDDRG